MAQDVDPGVAKQRSVHLKQRLCVYKGARK
jgi:hypothetical protein